MKSCIYIYLTTVFLFVLVSCTVSKNVAVDDKVWTIDFKKGGCLDVCQSYSLKIKNNGKYEYKGLYKVKKMGVQAGLLNKTHMNSLKELIAAAQWNNMKTEYGTHANDSQRKELNYSSTDIKKKVTYYQLEPQDIRKLEQLFDTIINHDEF